MHTTIKFAKVRPTAIIPTKRDEDAGYDIYANFDEDYMVILPHETVMIPTGIACACDTDYCFILKERSSTGTKGIAQRCGVIDSGYRGEIFVPITNTTDKEIYIAKKDSGITKGVPDGLMQFYPYEKAIAQLLLIPVPTVDVEEYTYEELKMIPSQRNVNAWGSTLK